MSNGNVPVYKQVWFWAVLGVVIIGGIIFASTNSGGDKSEVKGSSSESSSVQKDSAKKESETTKEYKIGDAVETDGVTRTITSVTIEDIPGDDNYATMLVNMKIENNSGKELIEKRDDYHFFRYSPRGKTVSGIVDHANSLRFIEKDQMKVLPVKDGQIVEGNIAIEVPIGGINVDGTDRVFDLTEYGVSFGGVGYQSIFDVYFK